MEVCKNFGVKNSLSQLRTLLIIVAMDVEEQALLDRATYQEVTYGKRFKIKTKRFSANDRKIIVANSGVGLVNAALTVATIYEHEQIDTILALGVCGALCPTLQIGDTVIANKIIQHDSVLSNEKGRRLIAAGELTLSLPDNQQIDPVIKCNAELIGWLQKTFTSARTGTILSGSEFVGCTKRKKLLKETHPEALLVDMETGAIAQLARKLNIPFAVAKTVADRANPETSVSEDYKTFLKQAAANSARVLRAISS